MITVLGIAIALLGAHAFYSAHQYGFFACQEACKFRILPQYWSTDVAGHPANMPVQPRLHEGPQQPSFAGFDTMVYSLGFQPAWLSGIRMHTCHK